MKHSVYDITVNQMSRTLKNLKSIIKKAQEHAKNAKFDENLFLQTRLAPDMLPFAKQIQIASDNAKMACARMTGKTAPVFEDNETTMEQLLGRIDKTLDYMRTFNEKDFENYHETKASFPWNPGMHLTGDDYFATFLIPNFYFHATTAYAILRQAGVALGKGDFMGELNWKK